MCGIVGYVGPKDLVPVLLEGLSKLEYRGYDSAGVAYIQNDEMNVYKIQGRLANLRNLLEGKSAQNCVGIGHTRWATHGSPSDINSHPHTDTYGDLAIVHNGIIENYMDLKKWLISKGVSFVSQTDTEVIAHLITHFYRGDLKNAVMEAADMLEGSYALGVICKDAPDQLVAIKKDSPLIVGKGEGENLIASDIPAVLEHTNKVYFLNDGEICDIGKDYIHIYDRYGKRIKKEIFTVDWDVSQAEKAGYEHFMIKEISEQPRALADTLRIKEGKIDLSEADIDAQMLKDIEKITIIACGTASHAGYIGKYAIESMARVSVDVEIASEFRYRNPILKKDQLCIVISQSGETADTIAAMRMVKAAGVKILAITNVLGSTVAREADRVLYTRAGMEIAVASTKAYTTQLLALYMICVEMSLAKGLITPEQYSYYVKEFESLPQKAEQTIKMQEYLQKFAAGRFMEHSAFFIGRGMDYALSMESSLKLKEVSYIHSEAYAAGELKHGTIALIEPNTLVVALITQMALKDKTAANIQEVRARGAYVLGIAQQKAKDLDKFADKVLYIPDTDDLIAPILAIIPMQIFAYYMAVQKGCDVDKPRNLAKSVTVE